MLLKNQELKEKKQGKLISTTKKVSTLPKWKKQSEEFRSVVKNTVGTTPTVNDDFINCKHCGRNYAQQPYEKHLAFCMKKAKESQMKPKITTSSMKPNLNVKFGKK